MAEIQFTKYERARMIGARALQIAKGAPVILKLTKQELEKINYSPITIAKLEFDRGVIPITIRRPLPLQAELA